MKRVLIKAFRCSSPNREWMTIRTGQPRPGIISVVPEDVIDGHALPVSKEEVELLLSALFYADRMGGRLEARRGDATALLKRLEALRREMETDDDLGGPNVSPDDPA